MLHALKHSCQGILSSIKRPINGILFERSMINLYIVIDDVLTLGRTGCAL